jgi:hypothetical protein
VAIAGEPPESGLQALIVAVFSVPVYDKFPAYIPADVFVDYVEVSPARERPAERRFYCVRVVWVADAANFESVKIVQKIDAAKICKRIVPSAVQYLQSCSTVVKKLAFKSKGAHRRQK